MNNKHFFSILRVAISVTLIALLLYLMRDKYADIARVIKGTRPDLFCLSLLLFVAAILIAAFRFKLIVLAQEIPLSFADAASLTFIGYFFNNFLPTAIGGDVVKAYYLSHKTTGKTGPFTSVFVDRVIGLITMVFMACAALLFFKGSLITEALRTTIFVITIISLMAILIAMNKRVAKIFTAWIKLFKPAEEKLRKVYHALNKYAGHSTLMFQSLAISVVSQLCYFISVGILAASIGSQVTIMDTLLRMPIVSATSLLPSINGLGVREGSIVLMFGPLIGKGNAFAISILLLLALFAVSLIGGITYLVSPQFKVRLKDVADNSKGMVAHGR